MDFPTWILCDLAATFLVTCMMALTPNPSPSNEGPSGIIGWAVVCVVLGPIALIPLTMVSICAVVVASFFGVGWLIDRAWARLRANNDGFNFELHAELPRIDPGFIPMPYARPIKDKCP